MSELEETKSPERGGIAPAPLPPPAAPANPRVAPEYFITRWAFLRALGIVYLIAFVSFWVQADGLFGRQGIAPLGEYLQQIRDADSSRFLTDCPTVFWLGSSNTAIHLVCALGTIAAALLAAGVLPAPSAIVAWILYLSLVKAGQDFFGFQWDGLLLEAGFLAIFFAPATAFLTLSRDDKPSRIVLWLLRWLCFRLMFSSGIVKLTSGDKTWRDFTAMTYHYFTQPLPTWTAWYMHQLPVWFQKLTTIFVLAIELIVPFSIFAPRRVRHIGAYVLAGFQVLLILTGNYCFFNLLSLVLFISLLDDNAFPARWRNSVPARSAEPASPANRARRLPFRTIIHGVLACGIVPMTLLAALEDAKLLDRDYMADRWPGVQHTMISGLQFHCIGYYGLFRDMSTQRPEIVFEGSNDGEHWLEYEFPYKPGDVNRRPTFVAPYQPRLDWQLWFVPLSPPRDTPRWFYMFVKRLLEGSPPVLTLLGKNPFPDAPPKYIRAVVYLYTFTDRASSNGAWWQRKKLGLWLQGVDLDDINWALGSDADKQ